jgi:hypothetical protein
VRWRRESQVQYLRKARRHSRRPRLRARGGADPLKRLRAAQRGVRSIFATHAITASTISAAGPFKSKPSATDTNSQALHGLLKKMNLLAD